MKFCSLWPCSALGTYAELLFFDQYQCSKYWPFHLHAFEKVVLKWKINLSFYFCTSFWCLTRFFKAFKAFAKPFEAPQRGLKIKKVGFFFSGIEMGRVKMLINLWDPSSKANIALDEELEWNGMNFSYWLQSST